MPIRSYHFVVIGFLVGCLLACSPQKEDKYADIPEELAGLYKAISEDPHNADLYLDLSRYYANAGQLDSALSNVLIAIRFDSTNSNAYIAVADVYLSMKDLETTEEMLKKAIALDTKNNEAYLKLGELYFLLKDYALSEETLKKAIQQETHNPKAYHILAWNYREKGDTLLAIRHYMVATEQDPDYFDAYMELGILYHCRLNPLAIDYYTNALNLKPNNTLTLYDMAMFYQATGNYDKALEKYRMILQIDNHHKQALHNMGWIYLMGQDKFEEAVVCFTKAIEVDSAYIEAIFNRGLSFEELGKYDNARQDYRYSLQLVNNYSLAIEGLNRLDKLQKK